MNEQVNTSAEPPLWEEISDEAAATYTGGLLDFTSPIPLFAFVVTYWVNNMLGPILDDIVNNFIDSLNPEGGDSPTASLFPDSTENTL